ncbi:MULTISPECIES: DUF952 domain-containing protein [Amycolatopsis methanolica group]|uniref:Glutathione S-transferase domain-containing protein n=1 Tax=Amycolatopsis methanolica 239 TaxID=1068978 RepID=A0A076MH97_AMYME|nr:DUF952 domain-containing protein [Amycolatopsis methanolica]AIJ20258.1 glutathione S-transferase domain-containing protein [Amycolatopsis methanolica 239]
MILHLCAAAEWTGADYRAPSLDTVGFIHCSDPGTVAIPANALYRGRTDLVLLEIDPARLDVPLRWEAGDPPHPDGILFPHVYGPIRAEAVVAVHPFPPNADGVFELPPRLAQRDPR